MRVIPPIEQLELDLTAARARIAELEDWQRRAVRVMTNLWGARETRAYFANRLQDLIKEATR